MYRNANRAIVLDLKGTIGVNDDFTDNGFVAVDRLAAERFGVCGFGDRCYHAANGLQITRFFRSVLTEFVGEPTDELVADFVACFLSYHPDSPLNSETLRVLDELRGIGLLAVLADGPFFEQKAKCLSLGLEMLVDRVVYPDYWGRGFRLPHPRGLMSIQNCNGLEPEQCTFVAAGPNRSFAVAHRLGWKTVRVLRPGSKAGLEEVGCNIASLASLARTIIGEANAA